MKTGVFMNKKKNRRTGTTAVLLSVLPVILICAALTSAWLKPGIVECSGFIEPETWVPLYSTASGIIVSGTLSDGKNITKNKTLLLIDSREPEWNIERLNAEIEILDTDMESIAGEISIVNRQIDIETKERARIMEINEKLYCAASIPFNDLERSKYEYNSFAAAGEREIQLIKKELINKNYREKKLKKELAYWKKILDECRIVSEINGVFYSAETVLSEKNVKLTLPLSNGRMLTKGQLLGYIIPPEGIKAKIIIPQKRISRCRTGQKVLVSPEARPQWNYKPLTGRLVAVSGITGNNGYYGYVKLDFPGNKLTELNNLNCGTITAEIETFKTKNPDFFIIRIWENWVSLVN